MVDEIIGRGAELEAIRTSYAGGRRVVTLLGPAGAGKTRLARTYVASSGETAVFMEMESAEPADVEPMIGEAQVRASRMTEKVILCIDGVERVARPIGDRLRALIAEDPSLFVLATSQVALGIPEEHRLYVSALDEESGVELFIRTARRLGVSFEEESLSPDDQRLLRRLVRRLDGLPLAIELAAARTTVLSLEELERRLDDRFRLLRDHEGARSGRHHSLLAALDAAWEQLDDDARAVLAQCAVFVGGFTAEWAERVIPDPDIDVLGAVQRLRDRSLIDTTDDPRRLGRLRLLESIRVYALQKLEALGLREAAERRHAECFAEDRSARLLEPRFDDQDLESANALAAFRRVRDRDPGLAARVLAASAPSLAVGGPPDDVMAFFEERPEHASMPPVERASLVRAHAQLLRVLGRTTEVIPLLTIALEGEARSEGGPRVLEPGSLDDATLLSVLRELGIAHREAGDATTAETMLERALEVARRMGDELSCALVLRNLGSLHRHGNRLAAAREYYEEALHLLERVPSPLAEAILTGNIAHLDLAEHRWAAAERRYRRALDLLAPANDRRTRGLYLGRLALAVLEQGRDEEADILSAEAIESVEKTRDPVTRSVVRAQRAWVLLQEERTDEAVEMLARLRGGWRLLRGRDAPDRHRALAEAIADALDAMATGSRSAPSTARALLGTVHDDWRYLVEKIEATGPSDPQETAGRAEISVGPTAAFFRIGDESVNLTRRGPMRRVLWRLVEARLYEPGTPLSVEALFAAGWPRQRAHSTAAANRVYGVIASLRRMGMAPFLLREAEGYLLSTTATLQLVEQTEERR